MKIVDFNVDDVSYIAANMRACDREEIFACRWDDDPGHLAQDLGATSQFGYIAGIERPIAAFGAMPLWPGVWSCWLFATDEWHRISTSVTKFVKRSMLPVLIRQGAHRLECRSMEGHPVGRWLEFLGATNEGRLEGFGRNKENFIVYSLRL